MSDKFKEFAWSSITTFIVSFAFAIAPLIGNSPLNKAAVFAIVMVGVRAGLKAVFHLLMSGKVGELLGAKGRV